jgi:hypothetical protein
VPSQQQPLQQQQQPPLPQQQPLQQQQQWSDDDFQPVVGVAKQKKAPFPAPAPPPAAALDMPGVGGGGGVVPGAGGVAVMAGVNGGGDEAVVPLPPRARGEPVAVQLPSQGELVLAYAHLHAIVFFIFCSTSQFLLLCSFLSGVSLHCSLINLNEKQFLFVPHVA